MLLVRFRKILYSNAIPIGKNDPVFEDWTLLAGSTKTTTLSSIQPRHHIPNYHPRVVPSGMTSLRVTQPSGMTSLRVTKLDNLFRCNSWNQAPEGLFSLNKRH